MLCVPLVAFVPLQLPEAVHAVAFVELHVSVEAAPLATDVGAALSEAAGSVEDWDGSTLALRPHAVSSNTAAAGTK